MEKIHWEVADRIIIKNRLGKLVKRGIRTNNGYEYTLTDGRIVLVTYSGELKWIKE